MDYVILSNDQAIFEPAFTPAIVVPRPGVITGSATDRSGGRTACAVGDEASVIVPGVAYTSGGFTTPGVGTLTILALGPDQQARQTTSGGRALILKGSQFRAQFQVNAPAVNPNSGVPDAVPIYFGTGHFVTTNTVWQAV
jgi:hypothetical protein